MINRLLKRTEFKGLLLMFLLSAGPISAQIEINGTIDFEATYGGKQSSFISNEVANEFRRPHLGIHQFNIFLFSAIDEDFFFNGRLQWDTWGSGKLNPLRITLASLSWEPAESALGVTIGRFVSPFGLYPRRQLANSNLFVNAPLLYGYFINISDTRGLWGKAGNEGNYGTDDVGLSTIYFGGYNTGIMANWVVVTEVLDLAVAITNAAPASPENFTNLQNLALITRIGFQPVIYWQQGVSFSHGSFMRRAAVNANFDKLEKFRQTLIGTDFILATSYFELSGEFAYSSWSIPGLDAKGFQLKPNAGLRTYDVANYGGYVDLKYEPPFFTGSYLALRVEKMFFDDLKQVAGSTLTIPDPWDNNLMRYSAAFGYKISRNVLFKMAFSEQVFDDETFKKEDFTFRAILSASM